MEENRKSKVVVIPAGPGKTLKKKPKRGAGLGISA